MPKFPFFLLACASNEHQNVNKKAHKVPAVKPLGRKCSKVVMEAMCPMGISLSPSEYYDDAAHLAITSSWNCARALSLFCVCLSRQKRAVVIFHFPREFSLSFPFFAFSTWFNFLLYFKHNNNIKWVSSKHVVICIVNFNSKASAATVDQPQYNKFNLVKSMQHSCTLHLISIVQYQVQERRWDGAV